MDKIEKKMIINQLEEIAKLQSEIKREWYMEPDERNPRYIEISAHDLQDVDTCWHIAHYVEPKSAQFMCALERIDFDKLLKFLKENRSDPAG